LTVFETFVDHFHDIAFAGNMNLVTLLLKQGAKVDVLPPAPEPDRASPLDLAILRGDPALVRTLLEHGANVNRCSPIIGSPLHVSCADKILHRVEIMKVGWILNNCWLLYS
jgi:ankyrin repeat protein